MATIEQVAQNALRALIPPPRLRLSEWIEGHVILPEGVSAQPGPVQLWPFQREIADAIGDPDLERVTLVKPVRVGFPHALGGRIAVDAASVDAGDGTTMHRVTVFTTPRTRRKVLAIKGAPGNRPLIDRAGSKTKTGARLWIVGVDTAKTQLFARLSRGGSIRLSGDLPRVWHEQVASERAIVRYRRGQPVRSFERIPGRRAEALDCLVYAMAARQIIRPDWDARRIELASPDAPAKARAPVLKSNWMQR